MTSNPPVLLNKEENKTLHKADSSPQRSPYLSSPAPSIHPDVYKLPSTFVDQNVKANTKYEGIPKSRYRSSIKRHSAYRDLEGWLHFRRLRSLGPWAAGRTLRSNALSHWPIHFHMRRLFLAI